MSFSLAVTPLPFKFYGKMGTTFPLRNTHIYVAYGAGVVVGGYQMISIPSVVVGCATHNQKEERGKKVGLRAFYCVFRLARFGVTFLLLGWPHGSALVW